MPVGKMSFDRMTLDKTACCHFEELHTKYIQNYNIIVLDGCAPFGQ
jgi:hypothetical protein